MNRMIWLFIIATTLPSVAWGFGDFGWESPDDDRSIYYLGQIFGQMGTVLLGEGGELVGELLRIFNIAVLTVGTIVVVYSMIVTTLSTAQEGEVMGKKWSSIWIPVRSATGLALMLPTGSGFSLIQILMMWITIQGVHGANQIWELVLDKVINQGQGITDSLSVDKGKMVSSAVGIFQAATCANQLNRNTAFLDETSNEKVTLYASPNGTNELWIGVRGYSAYEKTCGVIQATAKPSAFANQEQWDRQQLAAGELAFSYMYSYADEVAEFPNNPSEWTGDGVVRDGAMSMKGPITNVDLVSNGNNSALYASAAGDGWIHAGSYYFKLLGQTNNAPVISPPSYQAPKNYQYYGDNFVNEVRVPAGKYLAQSDGTSSTSDGIDSATVKLREPTGLSSEAKSAMGPAVSGLNSEMVKFIKMLSESDKDPITSFKKFGSGVLIAVEIIFFTLLILMPIIMGIACIASGSQPACYVAGIVVVILFPVLILVLALLWAAGVSLGIYLPMVPFFVFTFTALGWFMLVVEAIVAAPIVALGITAPGHEAMGKASPAVMIITNVFLRPSLIVIGFIASTRLVQAVIGMINYGFESFVIMNMGDLMLFGNIALIIIYAGVAIAAVHQSFSLTYVLADKVIRWIGGQAEQSQVEKAMEETKKSAETAASSTGAVMKGAGEALVDYAKSAVKKGSGEGEGEGKSKGGGVSLADTGGPKAPSGGGGDDGGAPPAPPPSTA